MDILCHSLKKDIHLIIFYLQDSHCMSAEKKRGKTKNIPQSGEPFRMQRCCYYKTREQYSNLNTY